MKTADMILGCIKRGLSSRVREVMACTISKAEGLMGKMKGQKKCEY